MTFIPNTDELRELRLWHWNCALSMSRAIQRYEQRLPTTFQRRQIASCRRRYTRHMRAVQALNDVVSGTAEQDAATTKKGNNDE